MLTAKGILFCLYRYQVDTLASVPAHGNRLLDRRGHTKLQYQELLSSWVMGCLRQFRQLLSKCRGPPKARASDSQPRTYRHISSKTPLEIRHKFWRFL